MRWENLFLKRKLNALINSVREPAKRAEIEKTEHGVNDVMMNNKSVMPGRRK